MSLSAPAKGLNSWVIYFYTCSILTFLFLPSCFLNRFCQSCQFSGWGGGVCDRNVFDRYSQYIHIGIVRKGLRMCQWRVERGDICQLCPPVSSEDKQIYINTIVAVKISKLFPTVS